MIIHPEGVSTPPAVLVENSKRRADVTPKHSAKMVAEAAVTSRL